MPSIRSKPWLWVWVPLFLLTLLLLSPAPGNLLRFASTTMRPPYPSAVPTKYDPDGNVQPFPGNTIIIPLSPSTELYASLLTLREKLLKSHLAPLFAKDSLAKPVNWHMTLFIGARDKIRTPGYWPQDIPVDMPLEDVLVALTDKLERFDLQCEPPYRMKVSGFGDTDYSIGVHLTPESADEEKRLRDLRNRLSKQLGIRHPGHDGFKFHVTLAYLLRWPDDRQKRELNALLQEHFQSMPARVDMGRPVFCSFKDMNGWEPVLKLADL
jgi:hypothetical protein